MFIFKRWCWHCIRSFFLLEADRLKTTFFILQILKPTKTLKTKTKNNRSQYLLHSVDQLLTYCHVCAIFPYINTSFANYYRHHVALPSICIFKEQGYSPTQSHPYYCIWEKSALTPLPNTFHIIVFNNFNNNIYIYKFLPLFKSTACLWNLS